MRASYLNWYDGAYSNLMEHFKQKGYPTNRLLASYSQLEIEALKWYDQPVKQTAWQKLKSTLIVLFFRKEFSYSYSGIEPLEQVDLVWWPTQNKHTVLQLPVYHYLANNGMKMLFVKDSSNFKKNLAKEADQVNHVEVVEKTKFGFNLDRWKFMRRALKGARGIPDFQTPTHCVSYRTIVIQALNLLYLYDSIQSIYSEAIEKLGPKMIVCGYELSYQTRALSTLIDNKEITLSTLQVGRMHYPVLKHTVIDYYYVYGDKPAEYLARAGAKTQAIVAGSDKMETLGDENVPTDVQKVVNQARQKYKQLVVVAFTGPGIAMSKAGHKSNVAALHNMAQQNPDVLYVCKLNTKDNDSYYQHANQLSNVLVIGRGHELIKFDIIHWIKECDYIITAISTSGMQAMYLRKPVITLDMLSELEGNYLIEEEAFMYANSSEKLLEICQKLSISSSYHLASERSKTFSDAYFKKHEIPSSQYIGDHMLTILRLSVHKKEEWVQHG